MDRISLKTRFHRTSCVVGTYGKGDSVPIDQQPVKSFNINPETGRPMSDMTAILRAQGLDQQRLLADLTEFKSSFLPDDISDVDALKYMQPRLCQLPSELAEYSEKVSKARLDEEHKKLLEEEEKRKEEEYNTFLEAAKKSKKDESSKYE